MKKIISIIIILLVIMAGVIVALLTNLKSKEVVQNTDVFEIEEIEESNTKNSKLHIEKNRNRFYVVKNCVNKFYDAYQKLNPENLQVNIELFEEDIKLSNLTDKYSEEVLAMLDQEYINYANITEDNVIKLAEKTEKFTAYVDKVYTKDLENSEYICFVEGRIKKIDSSQEKFKMIVRLGANNRFKVFLQDYMEANNLTDYNNDIDATTLIKTKIKDDKYNTFESQVITANEYINDIFSYYKIIIRDDVEEAYTLLEESYRNIRFNNLEEYKLYKKNNYAKLVASKLATYAQDIKEDYTLYTCKDSNGKYYIFRETAPFQYTVMLDNYTIPTDEFTKTYNNSKEKEKVVLNIKKFFMGIDDKNYGYSYSVLSEGFKANKYPNKEEFIKYAQENFFEKNEIEYVKYEKKNGVYIYQIKVKDDTGNKKQQKELNMIVKLNSGTDFEMSFGTN